MRYRLRTLLIIVPIFAILACAIGSEQSAVQQTAEIDAATLAALKEISPETCEQFDVDYLFAIDDDSPSNIWIYDVTLKDHFLTGPRKIQRILRISDQVDMTIQVQTPWYYIYCGKPEISIHASQSRGDQWLAKRLKKELLAEEDGCKTLIEFTRFFSCEIRCCSIVKLEIEAKTLNAYQGARAGSTSAAR